MAIPDSSHGFTLNASTTIGLSWSTGEDVPHITIEHSANVAEHHNIDSLVEAVHAAALNHGLAPLAGLRTRAVGREHYRVADGDPVHGFVAITCRIGPGRSAEAKKSFIAQVLTAAETHVAAESAKLNLAWSIEVTELDPEFRINHNQVRTALED